MPWQPLNKYCWDFWFVYQAQTLHVFYLQATRQACAYNPERRHNLASVGHAILTDFGWQEISPDLPALAARAGSHWDNLSIWTGSIVVKEGQYYMFYTARCSEDQFVLTAYEQRQPQNIGVAESSDLITWQRTRAAKDKPVIPNPGLGSGFDGVTWRDPWVMKDEMSQQFYAFITACPINVPINTGGAVAYITSPDLEGWHKPYRILYRSPEFHYLEVPQVFWRRIPGQGWRLYLLFSPYWNRLFERREPRGTYYVRSQPVERSLGYDCIPWEDEPANLLADSLYGGKLVNPESDTPIFFGFQLEDEAGHFVGGISDPQWAIFDSGTIRLSGSKPPVSQA